MKSGILTPLVTPLLEHDVLDTAGLKSLIDHVIAGGVHGIFLLGTTGEGPNLSENLRREVLDKAAEFVNGRVPLFVNVTGASFTDNVSLVSAAAGVGAAAAVYAGPLYAPVTQDQLAAHVQRFADQCALPVFLYNMPSHTNIRFAVDTVARLAKSPNIIGLKDSSADLMYMQALHQSVGPDFPVFIGPEEMLYPAITSAGVAGGVNGGSNLFPSLYVRLHDAAHAGNHTEAAKLHGEALRISSAVYGYGYLRGLKAALQAVGLCRARVMTEPAVELEPELAARIAAVVQPA